MHVECVGALTLTTGYFGHDVSESVLDCGSAERNAEVMREHQARDCEACRPWFDCELKLFEADFEPRPHAVPYDAHHAEHAFLL